MPIINEKKYSCEPCIRGHRATSCKHSERLMVLVRKPGRPMQGCGHTFETCGCGRFEDIFRIGEVEEPVPMATSFTSRFGVRKNKSRAVREKNVQFQEVRGGLKRIIPYPSISPPTLEHRKADISEVLSENIKTLVSKVRSRGRCINPPHKASTSPSPSSSLANIILNSNACIRTSEFHSTTSNPLPLITSLLPHTQDQTYQTYHPSNSFPKHQTNRTPLPILLPPSEHLFQPRFRAETPGYIDPSASSCIENATIPSGPSRISKSTNSHTGRSAMDSMNVKTQYLVAKENEKWKTAHWQLPKLLNSNPQLERIESSISKVKQS
ncbi:hypothetical protein EYC80_009674 [Monilinia laxa]|uniref:Copper-fist domain-containing protein n=1 Tax=Monilinia laxa TaxID=61186 RepID=A0A5N6JYK2_MONLA|nr:hypothetical protein EYC80_009674 [Monilinia laxa]